ncbi:MAG TPA: hypothetical protein VGF56_09755 [Rhizomicrobium sp.]
MKRVGPVRHVKIVANGFRATGLLLGLLSLILLFMFGGSLFLAAHQQSPPPSHPLDIHIYGIVGLLQNGAIGLGQGLNFLAALGLWLGVLVAVVSLLFLLFALFLFLVGRGVAARTGWARIAAALLAVLVLLVCGSVLFNLTREAATIVGLCMLTALYSLWVLGWRYRDA